MAIVLNLVKYKSDEEWAITTGTSHSVGFLRSCGILLNTCS